MSARTIACVEFECDRCGEGWANDEGTPHFEAAPGGTSGATAELVKQYRWTVVGDQHYCHTCSAERLCAEMGHEWGRWVESFNYGDPDWREKPAPAEQRFCEREYCHGRETRLLGDVDGPRYSPDERQAGERA